MMYELIGRLVVWGARRYLRKRYGDRPRQLAAALVVAGAVAGLIAAGRRGSSD